MRTTQHQYSQYLQQQKTLPPYITNNSSRKQQHMTHIDITLCDATNMTLNIISKSRNMEN